jgi:hypothetical protein
MLRKFEPTVIRDCVRQASTGCAEYRKRNPDDLEPSLIHYIHSPALEQELSCGIYGDYIKLHLVKFSPFPFDHMGYMVHGRGQNQEGSMSSALGIILLLASQYEVNITTSSHLCPLPAQEDNSGPMVEDSEHQEETPDVKSKGKHNRPDYLSHQMLGAHSIFRRRRLEQ